MQVPANILVRKQQQASEEEQAKRRLERALEKLAAKELAKALEIGEQQIEVSGTVLSLEDIIPELEATLQNHYRIVQQRFKDEAVRLVEEDRPESSFPITEAALAAWIAMRFAKQTASIIATLTNRYRRAVSIAEQTLTENGGVATRSAIAKTARRLVGPVTASQARTIANVETQDAAEATKEIVAEAVSGRVPRVLILDGGFEIPPTTPEEDQIQLMKSWQTVGDERVRPAHENTDGQTRKIDDPFDVGGEPMMHPGDSTMGASLSNIINCRCSAVYESIAD